MYINWLDQSNGVFFSSSPLSCDCCFSGFCFGWHFMWLKEVNVVPSCCHQSSTRIIQVSIDIHIIFLLIAFENFPCLFFLRRFFLLRGEKIRFDIWALHHFDLGRIFFMYILYIYMSEMSWCELWHRTTRQKKCLLNLADFGFDVTQSLSKYSPPYSWSKLIAI